MPDYRVARHLLAMARGVSLGAGCRCAVCGPSPFADAGPRSLIVGPNYTAFDALLDSAAPRVCAGCVSLLSGRPGDDPPPLRTSHCLAVDGHPATYPMTAGLAAIVESPPAQPFVLVWAESRKKHASLNAGVSTCDRIEIGADDSTITFLPALHIPVMHAVSELLAGFSRQSVVSGEYGAANVAKYGVSEWRERDVIVASVRGQSVLEFIVRIAPKGERAKSTEVDDVIDPIDRQAAQLLALIAQASTYRAEHGLEFWATYYRRRIERYRTAPLSAIVARLLDACHASPHAASTQEAVGMLDRFDEETTRLVERAIRDRPALLVALAYDLIPRQKRGPTKERMNHEGNDIAPVAAESRLF